MPASPPAAAANENSPLPAAFLRRVAAALGEPEAAAFRAALIEPAPIAVRLNPRKPSPAFAGAEPVPWCPAAGRYLPDRPVFALDPLWHAGAYYVQEPSSMLLDWALREALPDVADRPLRVLDLCAAPGGKTTLLASLLGDGSLLVANEAIRSRVPRLRENVARWGWPNVVVTNADPERFAAAELAGWFDVVVVDAPCSGEGLFRKDPKAAGEWSEANVALCALRQRRILQAARGLVRTGGLLVYSTCTFNREENDGAVASLLDGGGFEPAALEPPDAWGVTATEYGLQCWPQRVRGEGFYITALRRAGPPAEADASAVSFRPAAPAVPPDSEAAARALLAEPEGFTLRGADGGAMRAVPAALAADVERVTRALGARAVAAAGVLLGTWKGRDFVPAHEAALSIARRAGLPAWEMPRGVALAYLRKDPLPEPPPSLPTGWAVAAFEGQPLGWLKRLPDGRVNNYLPTELRLRMAASAAADD